MSAHEAALPPQATEAEEHIIGSMLLSPAAIAACQEIVVRGDFYRASHGRMFQAAVDLDAAGSPVDVVTLPDELERRGELEDCGGRVRVHELAALVPSTANVGHYARIVKEMALLRGLVRAGQEIARLGFDRPGDVENLIDRAQQLVHDLSSTTGSEEMVRLAGPLKEQWERMAQLMEAGGDLLGIPSGLRALDGVTGGFEPGNLIVVGARPSLGKSALALGFAHHIAVKQGLPAAIFSLEMSKPEVAQRLLTLQSGVPLQRLRRGKVSQEEWSRLAAATDALSKAPIHVDEDGSATAAHVRSSLRRLRQRAPGLALVVVDYLQLMGVDRSRGERRDLELGDVTRSLKQTAQTLRVPVVLLSQLNRESEKRSDRRPTLADLRDSGAIEADADIVILLHRKIEGQVTAIVAKNRNGPIEDVDLSWRGETTRFTDLEPRV